VRGRKAIWLFSPKNSEASQCWGAFGAIQALSTWTYSNKSFPLLYICAPPESTLLQFIKIFEHYADTHPERLHEEYMRVAVDALREAFPCVRSTR
jgi:hypothetical protein